MSFIVFIVCIAIALFLGAVLDRAALLLKERNEDYEFFSVAFNSKEDAQSIVDALVERFRKHGVIRMYDLYVLSDIDATPRDCKFGWTYLPEITIEQKEDKWVISTPNPKPLEK